MNNVKKMIKETLSGGPIVFDLHGLVEKEKNVNVRWKTRRGRNWLSYVGSQESVVREEGGDKGLSLGSKLVIRNLI